MNVTIRSDSVDNESTAVPQAQIWLEIDLSFLLRFKLSQGNPEITVYQKSAENVRRSL